jgi:hypothetical protein
MINKLHQRSLTLLAKYNLTIHSLSTATCVNNMFTKKFKFH